MANVKTLTDTIEVKDLEDGSKLRVEVFSCTEMGNESKPGLQMLYMGNFVNYEPVSAERMDYQARKVGGGPLYMEGSSWAVHEDQYVKVYYVPGTPPKARVEVKSRTSKPVVKEYPLPFEF
jgi:hypothetical protein